MVASYFAPWPRIFLDKPSMLGDSPWMFSTIRLKRNVIGYSKQQGCKGQSKRLYCTHHQYWKRFDEFCGGSRLIRQHSVYAIQFFFSSFIQNVRIYFFIPRAAVFYVAFFVHSLSAMSCVLSFFFRAMNFWYAVDQSNRMWTCIACNRIFLVRHKIVAIHLSLCVCVYVWLVIEQYYLQRPRGLLLYVCERGRLQLYSLVHFGAK